MSFVLKNVSVNRPICYTLNDGETTLRLDPKESTTIEDNQLDDYLKNLSKAKFLIITHKDDKKYAKKSNSSSKKN